jgi:NADH-quinone oxidoreductase subunit L
VIAASWVCLFSPAAAVVILALAGNRVTRHQAGLVAAASVLVSFLCSAYVFARLLGESPEERTHSSTLWTWLSAGDLRVGVELWIDPLSVFMMLVVSGVGFLIVSYATGYLRGDDEERRYHAYKALFVFSMLLLVMSGNLVLLLAGWGMVGLSSYLLINFWWRRPQAVHAGKKAFIMDAFGDATFALALFLLIQQIGAVDFGTVFSEAPDRIEHGSAVAVLIALGLLGGAAAKSAQVPLHTWLPDAMEGPTPVSALIHAATMVTAGVYLIARTNVLFELAPIVHETAAVLGGVTILLAGLIALVQTDIKRVIAYSTMSQIGYMFVGVGLGAYGAGMFHLMTHAFFKALLFMTAGIVIHALSGEQDIRKMGGLARELPLTYKLFLVGALSLAAIPPFSGFFSKDSILSSAIDAGPLGVAMWVIGIVGAVLTGLYTFRLLFIVFRGRQDPFVKQHLHKERFEGPLAMVWPCVILAVLAAFAGWLQVPGGWAAVDTWLEPSAESIPEASGWLLVVWVVASIAAAATGVAIAWRLYGRRGEVPARLRARFPQVAALLEHKFYFDELYDRVFYEPASRLALLLDRKVERPLVLTPPEEVGSGTRGLGRRVAATQSGLLRLYALLVAGGLVVLVVVFLAVQ